MKNTLTKSTGLGEDFLKNITGNLYDYICNLTYGLQQYIDNFYFPSMELRDEYDNIENKTIKGLVKFIIMENEAIIRNKGILFIIDVIKLVKKKEALMTSFFQMESGVMFTVKEELYKRLNDIKKDMDWKRYHLNIYQKKDKSIDEVCKFNEELEREFKQVEKISTEVPSIDVEEDVLRELVDTTFVQLIGTMQYLKNIMENSKSVYETALLCNQSISLLVYLYYALLSITEKPV